jgi:glycine/D-amino acid oxidase-like deaminating enzyme
VEALDRLSFRTRFPHIHANDVGIALLEPESGVLMARRAVRTLVAGLAQRGTQVLRTAAIAPQGEGRVRAIRLTDGRERAADAFVFACGPWLPKVFPELLGGMIRPTRQVLLHFGTPAGDDRFGPQHTPAWVDFAAGVYGVPDLEDEGLKVGIDTHGPPIDPDTADRVVDEASIATARAWLCRRIPALADAPLVSGRVCQYENTSSGDFLIDRHPLFDNVWIAGGGSGHGFKHGPAVGEYVAGLVSGTVRPEPRFQLTTKGTEPARAVF